MKRVLKIGIIIFLVLPTLAVLAVVAMAVWFSASVTIADNKSYKISQQAVTEYMQTTYKNIDYELVKSVKGKNSWPAERHYDRFFFHDKTNDIYFEVACLEQVHESSDNYDEVRKGTALAEQVYAAFPDIADDFRFYLKDDLSAPFGTKAYRGYLVWFTNTKANFRDMYSVIEYLNEHTDATHILLYEAETDTKAAWIDWLHFGESKYKEEPSIRYCHLWFDTHDFKDSKEFSEYLEEGYRNIYDRRF